LFVKDDAGGKIVLTVCGPGEVFGELSLFDGGPRTASAVALEEATLLVLDRDDLLAFLGQHPAASLDLLTTMGQRIRSTDEILRRRVARNINQEMEIRSTTVEDFGVIAFTATSLPRRQSRLVRGLDRLEPAPRRWLRSLPVRLPDDGGFAQAIFLSIF
jgi:CRP-like cAMP-binding protein